MKSRKFNVFVICMTLTALTSLANAADPFQVTNVNDAGLGSLRQAIANANSMGGNPTISFNTSPGSPFAAGIVNTISLTSGELPITAPLTIQGPGANALTISASHASRVFNINAGVGNPVIISGLTIRDGAPVASANGGGGILATTGMLNLTDSEVINNDASQSTSPIGGGIDNEGAVVNLVRCTLAANTSVTSGGAIENQTGSMTLVNCTVNGNATGANGTGGGIFSKSSLMLINTTIAGNSAQSGGNTFNSSGTIGFQNTIIAGGILLGSGGTGPDVNGTGYDSLDYNLIQDMSGGTFTGSTTHNITGVSPMLGALAGNGGATRTMALSVGSPAIDAGSSVGDPTTSALLATDQRGSTRPVNNPFIADAAGGNGSDIGAFELQPTAPTISVLPSAYAFENSSSGALPFTIGDNDTPIANLAVSASSDNQAVLPNSGILLSGAGTARTITLTPAIGQTGTATVTIAVNDGTFITHGFLIFTVTTPPVITSVASTTFTIGQQCPEVVTVGDNDMIVDVGTPCPFTITSSGSPMATIELGGVPLPEGVYFYNNFDGTATLGGIPGFGTAGNYALTFTATNSLGSSTPQNFILTINSPPVIESGPFYTPIPAVAGQPVTFSVMANDPDGNALTYNWDFGEGTGDTSPTVTHTFAQPGSYLVNVVVIDTASSFVNQQIFVSVTGTGTGVGGGDGGGNENESVVGAGPDSDGDGFSDAFEVAAGSDPASAGSTPTGSPVTASTLQALTVTKAAIKLNFARPGTDSIAFAGSLPISAEFNPNSEKVYVDAGGVVKTLSLNSKGLAKNGSDSAKFTIVSKKGMVAAQTAKYTVTFSRGSFTSTLTAAGLTNETQTNTSVPVKFTVIVGGKVYQNDQSLCYTAKAGKTGAAH